MKKIFLGLVLSLGAATAMADGYVGPHDGGGWGRTEQANVQCSSNNYAYAECGVNGDIVNAYVVVQQSKAACNYNSFGYRGNTLWVSNGCRAVFAVTYNTYGGGGGYGGGGHGGGGHGGGGYPPPRCENITCSSNGYAYNQCYASGRVRDARVINQLSKTSCILGQTWGYDRDMIWVDHGCRATFEVTTGW